MVVNSTAVRSNSLFNEQAQYYCGDIWLKSGIEPETFFVIVVSVYNKDLCSVANVLIDLADHALIISIEGRDNRITKSDIDRTQQRTLATRFYSSSIVVSSSASTYPQLEIDACLLDIHNTFYIWAKSGTHLVMFIVINSSHNNFLEVNRTIRPNMAYLVYGTEQTYFLIKYPYDKRAFSVFVPVLIAFS